MTISIATASALVATSTFDMSVLPDGTILPVEDAGEAWREFECLVGPHDPFWAEVDEEWAYYDAVEAELREWLDDPANKDDESYSDIYKDVYGVRPRW